MEVIRSLDCTVTTLRVACSSTRLSSMLLFLSSSFPKVVSHTERNLKMHSSPPSSLWLATLCRLTSLLVGPRISITVDRVLLPPSLVQKKKSTRPSRDQRDSSLIHVDLFRRCDAPRRVTVLCVCILVGTNRLGTGRCCIQCGSQCRCWPPQTPSL